MNERSIFLTALDKTDAAERDAWLDESCGGDPGLRQRVSELLRVYNDAGSFLEHSPLEVPPTVPGQTTAEPGETPCGTSAFDATRVGGDPEHELSLEFLGPPREPGHLGSLGPYEITEIIGRGGMGVVLKGHDTRLNRVVAVKVLAPELASNPTGRKRFLREAQAAAAVSHDHVVTIHAIDEAGGLPYLVMEYIAGLSLQQRIDRSGPLELKEILRIGRQMAAGLAAAHEQGLVHRDIKPANILLENGVERVKITDFGLARAVDDVSMTQTGVVAGTPQYMSPEQAQGQHLDHRSDLFSLGCVLYAMCTGRPPFRADTTIAVIRRVCDDRPRPIAQINAEIPEWLTVLIERLLEKRPDDRFQSAAEVAELLARCLAHVQQPGLVPLPVFRRGADPEGSLLSGTDRPEAVASAMAGAGAGHSHDSGIAAGFTSIVARLGSGRRWVVTAALVLLALAAFSVAEATGVTQVVPTIVRVLTGEGTLVVEIDDPAVSVQIDGEDLVITGAGVHEVRVSPGKYRVQAMKNGKPVLQELVTISRGGKQVVQVRREHGTARLDPVQGNEHSQGIVPRMVFEAFRGHPTSLLFARNGLLLAGDEAGTISFWDPGRLPRTVSAHRGQVWSLCQTDDGSLLASSGADGVVKLWTLEGQTLKLQASIDAHQGDVWRVSISPDGKLVASASDDRTARVFAVSSGELVARLDFEREVSTVIFSPDGQTLATGDLGGSVSFWERDTWKKIREMDAHQGSTRIAFSPDGALLASAGADKLIKLWRFSDLDEPIGVLQGAEEWIEDLQFSRDGRLLASVGGDWSWPDPERPDKIRLWDVQTGRELVAFDGHSSLVRQIAFSPDGRLIATCSRDGTVKLWNLGDLPIRQSTPERVRPEDAIAELRQFKGHDSVTALAFLPDGQTFLSAGGDRTIRWWDTRSGLRIGRIDTFGGTARCLAVSPDGARVAAGHYNGVVGLWEITTGAPLWKSTGHAGSVEAIAFTGDGLKILTGGMDSTVRVWDAGDGTAVRQFPSEGAVRALSVSSDGRQVLLGPDDGEVVLMDIETGAVTRRMSGLDGNVKCTALSPDGRYALAGASDQTIRLWGVETGREVRRLAGHVENATSVQFSPDGRFILSGGSDRTLRVWDVETGRQITSLSVQTQCTQRLAISPDGRHVLGGGGRVRQRDGQRYTDEGDGAIRLWQLPESVWPVSQAAEREPGALALQNSLGMALRLIPAGEFHMGTPAADLDDLPPDADWFFARWVSERRQAETPQHRVRITRPFHMSAHEVTVRQFRQFVAATGYRTRADNDPAGGFGYVNGEWRRGREFRWSNPGFAQDDDHPVCNVAWDDAVAFCRWLSETENATYRLPTEAEWEYACRAGTTTPFTSGDDVAALASVANIADRSLARVHESVVWAAAWDDAFPWTAPVGQFQPNAFGLYDMHGNAWEWCADVYDRGFYAESPEDDPLNRTNEPGENDHVFRGGGFDNWAGLVRSADRYSSHSDALRTEWAGFRVVRE